MLKQNDKNLTEDIKPKTNNKQLREVIPDNKVRNLTEDSEEDQDEEDKDEYAGADKD